MTVRLMTANLLDRGTSAVSLRNNLAAVRPDVLVVQELTEAVAPAIWNEFDYHLLSFRPDDSGVGVATRRPAALRVLPMATRHGMIATLAPEHWPEFAGPVEVIALHLMNPIERPPWTSSRLRRRQIEAVEAHIAASPVSRRVLCGDLNATPRWPAYRRLLNGYRDGISEADERSGRRPAPTWGPFRVGPRLLRIDHVLTSGVSVESARSWRLKESDHLALIADLVDDT